MEKELSVADVMREYRVPEWRARQIMAFASGKDASDVKRAPANMDADAGKGAGRAAQLGAKQRATEEREHRARVGEAMREFEEAQRAGERAGRRAAAKVGEFGTELAHATEQGKRAARAIDRAAQAFADKFRPDALHAVVKQFGKRADSHGRRQLDNQLRAAIGIPLSALDKPQRDRLDGWAAANVDRIVTVPERYFDRLRSDVLDAFEDATAPDVLAERIAEAYDVSESQAEVIARDQTLKLAADLNHDRMQSLGVEEAVWSTMNDARVCEDCDAMQGVRFRLDEGADGPCGPGSLPGGCHPGDRCFSAPVLDALIG